MLNGFKAFWANYKTRQAKKYLATYPALALEVLRQDDLIANQALTHFFEMDAAGRGPQRDTFANPVLSTLGYGGRSPLLRTLPKTTPYNMRQFSCYPPARRAIQALKLPILDLPFEIAVRRPIGSERYDKQPRPTPEQHERIVAVTEMLYRWNDEQPGREALEMVLEDLIVFGGGCIEVKDSTKDERPLFLWPVDAQSVRINTNWQPGSREFRYSQGRGFLYSSVGTTDDVKLQNEDMLYMKLNPRASTPFGLGYLEVAFETVNAYIGAFLFAQRRSSNSYPAFGLFLGENVTPEQCRKWQMYWENEIEGYGRIPILGGGRAPSVFSFAGSGQDPLWIQWQEFLIRVISMSFGISPMRLGLERDINRSTAEQGASDDWVTIAPIANVLRVYFTQWILWDRLGYTDLEFVWQVRVTDELKQAEILAQQYEMNAIKIDEIRAYYERPKLDDGLGDMTKTAYESALKAMIMSQQQSQQRDSNLDQQRQAHEFSMEEQDQMHEQSLEQIQRQPKPVMTQDASFVTPFDAEDIDTLSPRELAFLRALMARERRARFSDVAG